ncbi:cytochrome P450 [Diaporthe sp. PMI_573]|nr:cytochrome P450 [Diaporthaceae sp. PMI_573]
MIPHSFWFGHLEIMGKIQAKYPTDLHPQCMPLLLAQEYPEIAEQAVLYLDTWPFSHPMLAVFHPDMMAQFTQDNSRPKHTQMREEFHILSGCNDLVNQEGQVWKMWRSIFNPGFSVKNLMSLVPAFLEEIQVFRDWLNEIADSGQVVQLEAKAMRATGDIIGRATLGQRLHCQDGNNPFFESLKDAISWIVPDHSPPNILKSMHPLRRFQLWNANRIMKDYVKPRIERGVAEHAQSKGDTAGPKTIMSLAIKSYVNEVQGISGIAEVDPSFVEMAVSQIKIFMLAGHDTTGSTLCFIYHLLNRNKSALEAIRAEHDEVFGKDTTAVRANISANPQLLNQLPFTAAVIKETLRLFPPVGTVRQGSEDFFLTHPDTGMRYPTKGMMLFACSIAEHRTEQFWPRPHEFVPERWFAKEGEPLYVRKNAFRPFELGPRNCIGQELAQLELKAILAMTIRDFDISSIWNKDDPEWFGDKAYQGNLANEVTGHPKEYMPVRVLKRQ